MHLPYTFYMGDLPTTAGTLFDDSNNEGEAIITGIVLSNTSGSARTASIYIYNSVGPVSTYIFSQIPLAANETIVAEVKIPVYISSKSIRGVASGTGVSAIVSGLFEEVIPQ
jgi:hypothetical protein